MASSEPANSPRETKPCNIGGIVQNLAVLSHNGKRIRFLQAGNPHARDSKMSDDDQVIIERVEMGTGWVCFRPGAKTPNADRLPGYLNRTLCIWLKQNPGLSVRAAIPIMENGNTIAIHIWFD
jgi:hypothetical protein